VSRDGTIRIWSLSGPSTPKCVKVLKESGLGDYLVSEFMAFDKQSKILISQAFGTAEHLTSAKVWPLDTTGLNSEPKWVISDQTPTTALAVSQSHELIAVADIRHRLSIYHLEETLDRPIRVLSIPTAHAVSHLAFSQDGTVVIAGTRDAWIVIWDLSSIGDKPVTAFDTGHKELDFEKSHPDLDLLDISKDHSMLLTGSTHWSMSGGFADPTLRVWPLQHLVPRSPPWVVDQSGAEVNKVIVDGFFDGTSRFVIGVTNSASINVWDLSMARFDGKLDTGAPFARLKATTRIESDARSLDRGLLVLSQGQGVSVARIADITGGRALEAPKLSGFDGSVQFVQLSSSARFLVGGGGGSARLWDLTRVDPAAPSSSLAPNPYSEVRAIQLSGTGRTAITLRGKSLEFWDVERPSEPRLRYATDIDVKEFDDCIVCQIVISPDEHWVSLQGRVKDRSRIIEIGADSPARREFTVAARTWRVTKEIMFSPDSRWLFVNEADHIRVVYDLQGTSIQRQVFSDSGSYSAPTFSPDNKWVCFRRYINEFNDEIGRDKMVGFISPTDAVTDSKRRVPIRGFATQIDSVEFSPDGHWVALSGSHSYNHPLREQDDRQDDRYVQVMHLDADGWAKRADLVPIEYAASALRFSADGHWLFTGSQDITLGDRNVSARVWNLSSPLTPTSGQQLPNVVWNLKLVEFSPDSKWLLTVSGAEQYARLWALNGEKLEFVSKLIGPKPTLNNHWSAVFSPDSSSVALWTTDDTTPFYWKLNDNPINELGSAIPNGGGGIQDVNFSAGGRVLTVLNSGMSTTGKSGTEGDSFTFVDLSAFPEEDSYVITPVPTGAHSYLDREDLGLILAAGESVVAIPTDVQGQLRRAANVAGRNLSWNEWVKSGIAVRYRPTFPDVLVGADVIKAENDNFASLAAHQRTAEADQLRRDLLLWTLELDDAESCNDVAWELAKQRDLVDALELSSCALRLVPNDPNYHDSRGLALALSGRREEAIAEFEYFVENAKGIERYARDISVRRKWIESLRSGGDPFVGGIQ